MPRSPIIIIAAIAVVVILVVAVIFLVPRASRNRSQTGPITLEVWGLWDDPEVYKKSFKLFENTEQKVYGRKVEIRYRQMTFADYESKLTDQLNAGSGPDIFLIHQSWIPRYQDFLLAAPSKTRRGQLPTAERFKEVFVPTVSQALVKENKIYGITLSIDILQLFYNNQMFSEALIFNPPTTWTDLEKISRTLTQKQQNEIKRAGIALGTSDNISQAPDILALMMMQRGTQMVSPDGKTATFNAPRTEISNNQTVQTFPGALALEQYASFSNPSSPNYSWNAKMPQSVEAFIQGKVAMIFEYSYLRSFLSQTAPDLRFNATKIPQLYEPEFQPSRVALPQRLKPVEYTSFWSYVVNKNAASPEQAWDLLVFMLSQDFLQNYFQNTAANPPFQPSDVQTKLTEPKMLAQIFSKGKHPAEIDQIIAAMINQVNSGVAAQEAINAATSQITTLLQKE